MESPARLAINFRPGKRIRAPKRFADDPRVRVGKARDVLAQFIRSRAKQYPTECRIILAMNGQPLPVSLCTCASCAGKDQGWPVGYKWPIAESKLRRLRKRQRVGPDASYECGLHAQPEWFLRSLPSSKSITSFGKVAAVAPEHHENGPATRSIRLSDEIKPACWPMEAWPVVVSIQSEAQHDNV